MILKNAKQDIYVNAGHHLNDTGAVVNGFIERDEVMKIRDIAVPLLEQQGFNVFSVPDELDLADSIEWINERAFSLQDGLVIGLHLNRHENPAMNGTEGYFFDGYENSKNIAEVLARNVQQKLGTAIWEVRADTASGPGQLGIIRKTNCWASLIEFGYMTNEEDWKALQAPDGYERASEGLVRGVCELYWKPYQEIQTPPTGRPEPDNEEYEIRVSKSAKIIKIIRE